MMKISVMISELNFLVSNHIEEGNFDYINLQTSKHYKHLAEYIFNFLHSWIIIYCITLFMHLSGKEKHI